MQRFTSVASAHLIVGLIVLGHAVSPAHGEGPAPQARTNRTARFTTVTPSVGDGWAAVRLEASGSFSPSYVGIAMGPPHRIELHVPGVLPDAAPTAGRPGGLVTGVRMTPTTTGGTRITIDLSEHVAYEVMPRTDRRELTVVMVPAPVRQPSTVAAAKPLPARALQLSTLVPAPPLSTPGLALPRATPAASAQVTRPITPPVQPRTPIAFRGGSRSYGRVSLYANQSRIAVPGRAAVSSTELVTSAALQGGDRRDDGMEYGLDVRYARYSSPGRQPRTSVYEGFVGARMGEGTIRVRGGHVWVNDLGALGSVAGGLLEVRQPPASTGKLRLRGVVFGGVEPLAYALGYASAVEKFGALVALDGAGARRHAAGYVQVRHAGVRERSVVSLTNFLPVGQKVFIYQAAEYDVQPPSGQGRTGLNYFFTNARLSVAPRLELQVTANRGRSIDLRALSDDVVAGRPVPARTLDGLLYQSFGGRATVGIWRGARVYAGYSQDRNNREDAATARWLVGSYLSNIASTGVDVTFSDNLMDRATGRFHSRYLSIGRQAGRHVYLSGDYSTSLSIIRFLRSDGLIVETRPATSRFGGSTVVTLGRAITLLGTGEYTLDGDVRDLRVISGVTYRIR